VLLAASMTLLLAPAVLVLFGRGLFWLPPGLRRILPHVNLEGGDAPSSPAGPATEVGHEAPAHAITSEPG